MAKLLGLLNLLVISLLLSHQSNGEEGAQRKFIIAAYKLDIDAVTAALNDKSVSINNPFGDYDKEAFRDKWTLGYSPMGSNAWTALSAVVNANRYDDPPEEIPNTTQGLERSKNIREKYSKDVLELRKIKRLELVKLLVSRGADIDVSDYAGATPLYDATCDRHEEVALLLIEAGAKVNTKTGIYIDGTGDITPLHRAVGMPRVLKALLEKNADKEAKDSEGETPLDWAIRKEDKECIKLLKEAQPANKK